MKALLLFVPALLMATPAAASPKDEPEFGEVMRTLNDPRMADQFATMAQALSKALLNMPVGEIQAAIEGRPATAADKRLTVRDIGRADDPNFEKNLERQIAAAKPAIQSSMKAMASALPAMTKAMEGAAEAMERAMTNMPSPTYPKR